MAAKWKALKDILVERDATHLSRGKARRQVRVVAVEVRRSRHEKLDEEKT
jgi:hypothetical protein